jgi:hypothetical protein
MRLGGESMISCSSGEGVLAATVLGDRRAVAIFRTFPALKFGTICGAKIQQMVNQWGARAVRLSVAS